MTILAKIIFPLLIASRRIAVPHKVVTQRLEQNLLEIAVLWLFLMSSMTFVAYLNAKDVIQVAAQRLFPAEISTKAHMFWVAINCRVAQSNSCAHNTAMVNN
jgi:hypothetical protein